MKGNNKKKKKKINSIFDNCRETASQEIFLRSCGFAQRGVPPDSDPSVLGASSSPPSNHGTAPRRDSETDHVIEELVESHAVRFVSPPESPSTVDSEEEDRTVPVDSIPLENLLPSSSSSRLESPPAKKLKVPLRDVVEAIVMNSRRTEEEEGEDRGVEKKKRRSCVQILIEKGFNFP